MSSQQQANSSRRGYTLVEILIVVVVMGIAAALVIPSLGQTHVLRVQAAVRAIIADITYAQYDALAFQSGRAMLFDEDTNSYMLLEVTGLTLDPDNDVLYSPSGPGQRYIVSLDEPRYGGALIQNVNFDGTDSLIFDEIGGPVIAPGSDVLSSGGSLEVAGPNSVWRINIAAFSGKVTVTEVSAP